MRFFFGPQKRQEPEPVFLSLSVMLSAEAVTEAWGDSWPPLEGRPLLLRAKLEAGGGIKHRLPAAMLRGDSSPSRPQGAGLRLLLITARTHAQFWHLITFLVPRKPLSVSLLTE